MAAMSELSLTDASLQPNEVTLDALRSWLMQASYDVELDDDGDLVVRDETVCLVAIQGDVVTLRATYTLDEGRSAGELLLLANEINAQYRFLKAFLRPDTARMWFQYDVPFRGGLAKRHFLAALRKFLHLPPIALEDVQHQDFAQWSAMAKQ